MEEWIRYRGKISLFREVNEIKAYRDRSQRSILEKRYGTMGRRQPNAVLKDMICLGLLLRVHSRGFVSVSHSVSITSLRVDLSNPPCIPVTRHSDPDLGMKSPEHKFPRIKSFRIVHFCRQNIMVEWNVSRTVNEMNKKANLRSAQALCVI